MTCSNNHCIVSPPRRKVERLRDPTPAPIYKRVVNRAPTPEPDVIERIIIKRRPRQIIERIIETPRKPPPRIVEKIVYVPMCQCHRAPQPQRQPSCGC